jgi:hypothetical protein
MTLNEGDVSSLDKYTFLSKFVYLFPDEFLGLPPKQEIDFSIELKPDTKPMSKSPYQIFMHEIREL